MTKKTENLPPLEKSLNEITTLIDTMEHGELTLEKSLEQFERGIKLIKHCQKILTTAEQKVQRLMQQHDGAVLISEEEAEGRDDEQDGH